MKFRYSHKYISVICLLCVLLVCSTVRIQNSPADSSRKLSEQVLRLRILANSDSNFDQQQKHRVRELITARLQPALASLQTKQEAMTVLQESIDFLTADISAVTQADGSGYPVSVQLGSHLFPHKTYHQLSFPAGFYDTLLITLGEGQGSNWWCLAFPPLCFPTDEFSYVPEPLQTEKETRPIGFGLLSFLRRLFHR